MTGSVYFDDGQVRLLVGDAREVLPGLPDRSVDWILRSAVVWHEPNAMRWRRRSTRSNALLGAGMNAERLHALSGLVHRLPASAAETSPMSPPGRVYRRWSMSATPVAHT